MVGTPTGEKTNKGKNVYSWSYADPLVARLTNPDSIVVPCGRCLGCRLDYARKWADRMFLELQCHDRAIFATLTYATEKLPIYYSEEDDEYGFTLRKRDCQLFMKRLRKRFPDKKVSFFLAGEYGGRTDRPHYHVILYDVGLDDFSDLEYYKSNELKQPIYISREFEQIWQNGLCTLAECTYETCNYTARYVTKKAFKDVIEPDGRQSEFCLMSRKPAIGKRFLDEHPEVLDKEFIYIGTESGCVKIPVPDYFLDKLEEQFPVRVGLIRKKRKDLNREDLFLESKTNELSHLEQLRIDEKHKEAVTRCLSRDNI